MLGLRLIADPRLIYGVVFILPPVHCGRVLCYWVRKIYQGQRGGHFTHQGDNYRVICVLTLSTLTIFVSSLLALPLHERTQHVRHGKSMKKLLSPRIPALLPVPSPGSCFLSSCVCLQENMCSIVYTCLWTYLHQRTDWNTVDFISPPAHPLLLLTQPSPKDNSSPPIAHSSSLCQP